MYAQGSEDFTLDTPSDSNTKFTTHTNVYSMQSKTVNPETPFIHMLEAVPVTSRPFFNFSALAMRLLLDYA